MYMWQSHVEIEDHSVVYFDHIAPIEVPYHWTSSKGGAHTHFIDLLGTVEPRLSEPQISGCSDYPASISAHSI